MIVYISWLIGQGEVQNGQTVSVGQQDSNYHLLFPDDHCSHWRLRRGTFAESNLKFCHYKDYLHTFKHVACLAKLASRAKKWLTPAAII